MATMSPPTAPIRLATRPSAPGRSGKAMRTRYPAMAQRLCDQCEQAVSARSARRGGSGGLGGGTGRHVLIDVLTLGQAGDLVHQTIREATALGMVVPLHRIV